MAFLIAVEASNLAKVFLLLSSRMIGVPPCGRGAAFSALSPFSVGLLLLFPPGFFVLGLGPLLGLGVGLTLALALWGRLGL